MKKERQAREGGGDSADFLCKLLIEANAGKVERAIEKATSRCAEESEYIVEPEKIEYSGSRVPAVRA